LAIRRERREYKSKIGLIIKRWKITKQKI
jgi:hypothetical protein